MWWLESHQRKVEVNQQQVYFLKRTFCFIFCLFFFLHEAVSLSLAFVRQAHIIWMPVLHTSPPAWHERTKQTLSKISVCHEAAQENQTHIKLHEALWHLEFLKPAMFTSLRFLPSYCDYINTLIHNKHLFSLQIISVHSKLYFQQRTSHACCKHLIFGEKLFRSLTDFLWVLFQKPDSSSRRMNSGPLDRSLCRRVLQTKCARPLGDPPRPSFAAEEHTLACSSKTIVCRENEIHAYTKTFSEPPWIRPLPFNN